MSFRVLSRAAAALIAGGLFCLPAAVPDRPRFNAADYLEHVKYLASPELRGRGTGTPELAKAADYIQKTFERAGLKPLDGKSYRQPFQVTTNARLGKNNRFEYRSNGQKKALERKDFQPFNFSASGKFSAPVVFAGYGITAPEYNYDDYAGLDVKEKFVLVLRHEPQEFDEKSVFSGKLYTEHSQFAAKATNAKNHGARGVILVADVAAHPSEGDDLEPFGKTVGPNQAGIPFVQVRAAVAGEWLARAGKDLKSLQEAIDHDLKPQSFALPAEMTVAMELDLRRDLKTVDNVAGYLAGETDEYIVLGAHYDHLGLGEQYSMAPSQAGTAHLGADDNASGTAAVLELARYFGARPKPKRGIVFLAFAAEEQGLLGSSHYVNNPKLPLNRAVAMFNMDMVGRIRDRKLYIGGLGSGSSFKALIDEVSGETPLKLEFSEQGGYGASDHASFTTKQVPVLFFFSGLHADYHKPSDTWDKIDAGEAAWLLDFVARASERLIEAPDRPQFVRVAEPPRPLGGAGGPGYGAYFGSIPDMADQKNGVKFADVREGSPASKAGLKGGDILVEFGGKPIQNLYDFTYALRTHKPGEVVRVKVLREGAPLEVEVTLEKRR